jgi:hypothetical protein
MPKRQTGYFPDFPARLESVLTPESGGPTWTDGRSVAVGCCWVLAFLESPGQGVAQGAGVVFP